MDRIDDNYLKEHLKLTESFIARHARKMGNFTKPRSYWLQTVTTYLRELEAKAIKKAQGKKIDKAALKAELIADLELARMKYQRKGKL